MEDSLQLTADIILGTEEHRYDDTPSDDCDPVVYRQFVEELDERLRQQRIGTIFKANACPYCDRALEIWEGVDDLTSEDADPDALWSCRVEICMNCAHWTVQRITDYTWPRGGGWGAQFNGCASRLGKFSPTLPDGCGVELAVALRRRPELYHSIDTSRFEKLVAEIFRANYSHAEVFHVGRSDDDGIDVIFVSVDGERWLIQAKRRESPRASEGVGTIRSLLGTLLVNDTLKGVVVSTADHFTVRARQMAQRADARGYTIELVDRGKLDRMLDKMLPYRAWINALHFVQQQKIDPRMEADRDFFPPFSCLSTRSRGLSNVSFEQMLTVAGGGAPEQLALNEVARRQKEAAAKQLRLFSKGPDK